MKIPQLKVLLFRCYGCGRLITCNEVVTGEPCRKCQGVHKRLALKFTWKEEVRVLWLWVTGRLMLTLPGVDI